jgi:hypothetical protein
MLVPELVFIAMGGIALFLTLQKHCVKLFESHGISSCLCLLLN